MDSGDYSPPPSIPSGGFTRVEPELSYNNQPTAEDDYAAQAPSMSSPGLMRNSEPQFPEEYGQRTMAGEPHVQPPSRTDLHHGQGNSITGGNDNRWLAQTGDQAPPSHSALVHDNNSAPAFKDGSGYVSAPSQSAMVRQNQSNPGEYQVVDPQEYAGFSIPGRHFGKGNLTGP
ncbi:hypothetical protein HanXRQr2_Chr09g0389751 [Helianthus annuus]|uniref:Uncharacterized protein n=1 Tax=Helianthus annuus TaxID=4232 RepID=A0A9K3N8E4_HELAN|nr:hypothetical protein HanXRQr2_Chr09g0389751 [Helianthus annuus]KAJ0893255.1 hypothetical protein HanPSC8_Chr09g0375581 [Helianthus annuus]